jgi:cell division septal protein FtsQ
MKYLISLNGNIFLFRRRDGLFVMPKNKIRKIRIFLLRLLLLIFLFLTLVFVFWKTLLELNFKPISRFLIAAVPRRF